jgi:hypothetical protein
MKNERAPNCPAYLAKRLTPGDGTAQNHLARGGWPPRDDAGVLADSTAPSIGTSSP